MLQEFLSVKFPQGQEEAETPASLRRTHATASYLVAATCAQFSGMVNFK